MADRTVAEIRDLATAFRIPHAPVGNGATIAEPTTSASASVFRRNPRDGFLEPARPYRLLPAVLRPARPAPRLGEHNGTWRDTAAAAAPTAARAPPQHRGLGTSCRSPGCGCST